jgi:hypothetical protein
MDPASDSAAEGTTETGSALRYRRYAVLTAPALAALLILAGFLLDPDIGGSGGSLARSYAAHPGRIELSALSFHFAYALLIVPLLALALPIRARGGWLANLALLFAVLGLTTLPGLLVTDFYDVAIYGKLGPEAWQTVNDRLQALPGSVAFLVPTLIGFVLALPTAMLAAYRARLLPWWPAVVFLAAEVSARVLPGGIGVLLLGVAVGCLTFVLLHVERAAGRASWQGSAITAPA